MNPGTWSTSAQRGGTWAEERRGRPHTFPSATMWADTTHRSRPRHRAHPATRRKRSHRPWNIRMRPPRDPLGCIFCVDRSTIGAYMQGSQVQVNDVRVYTSKHDMRRTWAHQETHKRKMLGLTKPAHRPPPLLSTPRQITIKPARKWAVHRSLTKRIPGFMIAVNTSATGHDEQEAKRSRKTA